MGLKDCKSPAPKLTGRRLVSFRPVIPGVKAGVIGSNGTHKKKHPPGESWTKPSPADGGQFNTNIPQGQIPVNNLVRMAGQMQHKPVVPTITPSFRRKPESRTLGSRLVLFLEDFLDSGFRRNDGCLDISCQARLRCPVGAGFKPAHARCQDGSAMAASEFRTEFAVAGRTGYKPAPTPMKIPVKVFIIVSGARFCPSISTIVRIKRNTRPGGSTGAKPERAGSNSLLSYHPGKGLSNASK